MNDLIRKDSIEEIAGHRASALQLYAQGFEALLAAQRAHARACTGLGHSISSMPSDDFRFLGAGDTGEKFAAKMRTLMDRDIWRALLVTTKLGSMMDEVERRSFDDGIAKDPPEITAETVYATLTRLAADTPAIFRRGLVSAFQSLSNEYRSNDGFKLGPRMIFSYALDVRFWNDDRGRRKPWASLSGRGRQTLQDIDRVLHILDGKQPPEHLQGIVQASAEAVRSKDPSEWVAETPYLKVKFYQKGSGHLYVMRDDLREKANKLIAEHFGETIGAGPDVAGQRRNAA